MFEEGNSSWKGEMELSTSDLLALSHEMGRKGGNTAHCSCDFQQRLPAVTLRTAVTSATNPLHPRPADRQHLSVMLVSVL